MPPNKQRAVANVRERKRTQSLNQAYKTLQAIVPKEPSDKMSKIHTLKLALAYIDFLNDILKNSDSDCKKATVDTPPPSSSSIVNNVVSLNDSNLTSPVHDCITFGQNSASMSPDLSQCSHYPPMAGTYAPKSLSSATSEEDEDYQPRSAKRAKMDHDTSITPLMIPDTCFYAACYSTRHKETYPYQLNTNFHTVQRPTLFGPTIQSPCTSAHNIQHSLLSNHNAYPSSSELSRDLRDAFRDYRALKRKYI